MAKKPKTHKRKSKSHKKDKDKSNLSYLIVGVLAIIIIVAISKYAGKQEEIPVEVVIPEPEPPVEITPTPRELDQAREPVQEVEGLYDYRMEGYESDVVLSKDPANVVSNIECSYSRNAVSFTVTNRYDQPFHLFFNQVPTPDNLILFNVNGRKLYFMDCEGKDVLMPGERVVCSQVGNLFLQEPKETFKDQDLNRMQIKLYGASDYITFMCEP